MVKKWRKKPVIDENLKPVIIINTLEGKMMATVGDYIIKDIKSRFYPCKPDIFLATYEEVEEERL